MNEERFHELKDAYVLGALPEGERADFEAYLAAHPEHQAEIDDLGGLAGMLAFAPTEHEPAPGLRSRVMEVVEAEASVPRIGRPEPSAGPGRYASLRNLAVAAAAVLLIGLVSWNVLLQDEVEDLQGEVEETRSEMQEARAEVEEAQTRQAEASSGARTIQLGGTWVEQGTQAEVAEIDEDRIVLVLEDIPSVPEDRTLQIWVIRDEVPQPSGLFEPSGEFTATAVSTPLREGDTIAVTVEPAGGSEQPTTDPVLLRQI